MFNATVTATVDLETGERAVIAEQQFANVLDADKFACVQAHGAPDASWEIVAKLTVKKACSTVMASRNKHIGIYLGLGGNSTPAYQYLKAPLTCEVLRNCYPQAGDEPCVELRITQTHLFVQPA